MSNFDLNDTDESFGATPKSKKKAKCLDSDSEDDGAGQNPSIDDILSEDESSASSSIHTPKLTEDEIVESTDDESPTGLGEMMNSFRSGAHSSTLLHPLETETPKQNLSMSQYREEIIDSEGEDSDIVEDSEDDTVQIMTKSVSIVDVSSDEESTKAPKGQTSIKQFFPNIQKLEPVVQQPIKKKVTKFEHETQLRKVNSLEVDLSRADNAMRSVDLKQLPDQGKSLLEKVQSLRNSIIVQREILNNMTVEEPKPTTMNTKFEVDWDQIKKGMEEVAPKTIGKKGMETYNMQKQLAAEALNSIHNSLETRPGDVETMDDPNGLKVPLMPHQKRALTWLIWREKQKPSGGLLADDMGLGKTLTMISLIIKSKELEGDDEEKENHRNKYPGGTLVICPASVMNQWASEIDKRTKRGLLDLEVYHGPKRETKPKKLARHDVVLTTYSIIQSENERNGAIFGVRWRRIILDEAHQIRNFKSKTAEGVFRLSGKSRWSLTGTPIHNKENDMFSVIKFLRCAPFDDFQTWKHWISNKSTGGDTRLHTVISSLMLRRTKVELIEAGGLQSLPPKNEEIIFISLEKEEMNVYQKLLLFSQTLFAQFLHQRAEKNQEIVNMKFCSSPPDPNGEYSKMRNRLLKMNKVQEISQHHILVLLLRLRQMCCHPFLIKQTIEGDEDLGSGNDDDDDIETPNLLDQLNRLTLEEDEYAPPVNSKEDPVSFNAASKNLIKSSHPMFRAENASSKIKAVIKTFTENVEGNDKAIIVSQWTSYLNLIAIHLKEAKICFGELNGSIPVHKRMPIIDDFNDENSNTKVLLLSLTAGGVGLNLVGANHLFLIDLHWNPQLENQAQDRIYRVGQKKEVRVYKFLAQDTIEMRIKALQDVKLDVAKSVLTGSKRVTDNKLSLQDLKMLFGF